MKDICGPHIIFYDNNPGVFASSLQLTNVLVPLPPKEYTDDCILRLLPSCMSLKLDHDNPY